MSATSEVAWHAEQLRRLMRDAPRRLIKYPSHMFAPRSFVAHQYLMKTEDFYPEPRRLLIGRALVEVATGIGRPRIYGALLFISEECTTTSAKQRTHSHLVTCRFSEQEKMRAGNSEANRTSVVVLN